MKRALPFLAAAFCVHTAFAQSATHSPARFEIMAGANFAKLTTPSSEDHADTRTALVVGVGVIKPFAPGWAFQPELTYSMKGAKTGDGTFDATFKISYIEVPLLLRYEMPTQSSMRPFFHAGPALAFKTSCSIEGSDGTQSVSVGCDGGDSKTKTFDVGLMFGGGLAFKQMDHTFSVGLRYNLGLIEIADGAESKNRVLSLVGTFEWPWGK